MADKDHHINKHPFKIPFVCGARNLGEALRRIAEGAAMIRIKGDAGTGNVVNAVEHCRALFGEIRRLTSMAEEEIYTFAKINQVSYELV
jgi:pyridoxal 5'-phosphate synthase pdxS subunit